MPAILSKPLPQAFYVNERQLVHEMVRNRRSQGPKVKSLRELKTRRNWGRQTAETLSLQEDSFFPMSSIALSCLEALHDNPEIDVDPNFIDALEMYSLNRKEVLVPHKVVMPLLEKRFGTGKVKMSLKFA